MSEDTRTPGGPHHGPLRVILATDCGSTTSKARLFKFIDGFYRFVASGEAPTTVEAPFEDVTLGVRNAVREIEETTGHRLLAEDGIIHGQGENDSGVDLYVTTSSAGGGLQMLVAGIAKSLTGESAERAALGAGAIVLDVISTDDGRRVDQKIERIRNLRPDMTLLAGGTDGGAMDLVSQIAELIVSAEPKARFGQDYKMPLVYAGNKNAREHMKGIFSSEFEFTFVDNIRPTLEVENTEPSRDAIHQLFMEHVMSHAPGYDRLMKWADVPIMPTPAGEGAMFRTMAEQYAANVIGVGLGGATTNVYSIYDRKFVRTVSANLGMSYSICNVLKEAGVDNIVRWIPFEVDRTELCDRLRNKMIRPTTIPETLEDLVVEHAVAREAIRLGFAHHKFLARPLQGAKVETSLSRMFDQSFGETYIDMLKVDWIAGTGGLLSHAPVRAQSASILIDAFQPEGITRLAQDSVFMMPHLGVLSTVAPDVAMEIFERDCLVRLGTCIAPRGTGTLGDRAITLDLQTSDGRSISEEICYGSIRRIPLAESQTAQGEIRPSRGLDIGAGSGHSTNATLHGGVAGLIVDARGRPIKLPETDNERWVKLSEWFTELDAYSLQEIKR